MVDALEQPELEKEVLSAIAATLPGRAVRYVLNTHTHYDHVALNAALVRRHGAEVVDNASGEIPSEGKWFQGPQRKALMLPMPNCHTEEDCVVWVPQDRVLLVGDIFGWGLIPLSRELSAETAALLKDTYQRLIDFDAAVVVPGHGPLCSTAELKRWVEYLDWLVAGALFLRVIGHYSQDRTCLNSSSPPRTHFFIRGFVQFYSWSSQGRGKNVPKSPTFFLSSSSSEKDRF